MYYSAYSDDALGVYVLLLSIIDFLSFLLVKLGNESLPAQFKLCGEVVFAANMSTTH